MFWSLSRGHLETEGGMETPFYPGALWSEKLMRTLSPVRATLSHSDSTTFIRLITLEINTAHGQGSQIVLCARRCARKPRHAPTCAASPPAPVRTAREQGHPDGMRRGGSGRHPGLADPPLRSSFLCGCPLETSILLPPLPAVRSKPNHEVPFGESVMRTPGTLCSPVSSPAFVAGINRLAPALFLFSPPSTEKWMGV